MDIPFLLKFLTVLVDGPEKKFLDKPEVVTVLNVKSVTPLASCEEASPSMCKLGPNFNPKSLDPRISSGTISLSVK